ncbi:MAG: 50S ribosomal protein L18e [Candidatus Aenigmatarchaeota archaeon]
MKKNPQLKGIIEQLKKREEGIWKALAKELSRPRKNIKKVNVYKIEKFAQKNDFVLVPGILLGAGEIKKPVNIAAYRFSAAAKKKIENAGGVCLSIPELMEKRPKGSGVKIIG